MVAASDIGWGSYGNYEGAFFRGRIPYILPAQPDFLDKCLATITAVESGKYDAINGYDRCIISLGLIQFCEAGQFGVTNLLGRCADVDAFMMNNFVTKFPVSVEFKRVPQGPYRFHQNGVAVDNLDAQRKLFLGGSPGTKGSWTPETTAHAKDVAAWMANIWNYPLFCRIQAEYTKVRLPSYIMAGAKKALFDGMTANDQFGWAGALRAAFYSFTINLPTVADKSLAKAMQDPAWAKASDEEKFYMAVKALTFSPGISIYPIRYEGIAPVLNRLFGITAPLKATELHDTTPVHHEVPMTEEELEAYGRQFYMWDDPSKKNS